MSMAILRESLTKKDLAMNKFIKKIINAFKKGQRFGKAKALTKWGRKAKAYAKKN